MPTLNTKQLNTDNSVLLRELFYGAPKTRKTWLAGTAAEAGFNVILLDSDHGYHILMKQLSDAAKKRLMIFECRDSLKLPTASTFIAKFLKAGKVLFDEETRRVVGLPQNITNTTIELSVERHLNANTVLIVDSYSAIVSSLKFAYAKEHNIDLTDAEKEGWDGYAWTGMLASFIVEKLTQLPCHVIMIAHQTMYEKRAADGKKVEWSRRVIKSTSGPHSMTIGDKFSDILYFINASAAVTKVETRAEKDAEGGSRIIPPDSYTWDKLQWADICKLANIPLPPKDLPFLDFTVEKPEVKPVVQKKINPKPAKASMFGLKKYDK